MNEISEPDKSAILWALRKINEKLKKAGHSIMGYSIEEYEELNKELNNYKRMVDISKGEIKRLEKEVKEAKKNSSDYTAATEHLRREVVEVRDRLEESDERLLESREKIVELNKQLDHLVERKGQIVQNNLELTNYIRALEGRNLWQRILNKS